jgi:hypothetical protein
MPANFFPSHMTFGFIQTGVSALKKLLSAFHSPRMKSHPVSSAVNYSENDNSELVKQMDVAVGTTPRSF